MISTENHMIKKNDLSAHEFTNPFYFQMHYLAHALYMRNMLFCFRGIWFLAIHIMCKQFAGTLLFNFKN